MDNTPPVIQVADAIMKTIADPSLSNVVSDIELAIHLAKQLHELGQKHPSLGEIIGSFFR
jgi:hypothetical protein